METSFANGGQLSASNAEVWTHPSTIIKGLKWMLKSDAPLLVNPKPSWPWLRVNIYPVKGYSITVNLNDAESQAGAPKVSLLDDETKLVTSRLGDDRFRVAGTAEFNGYNRDIRSDRIKPLVDWVNQCFPKINTRSVVPWAGLRPMMPNMMPRVGRGKAANVFYNTGHGHLGWTLSAVTADMVAEVISAQALAECATIISGSTNLARVST